MFSIAAINDTDSRAQWEPLAPTKESQEFHLSQNYHEGLLKLHAKDYAKARELLESVLKDPLISSSQVKHNASDGHLLQLRFLSLKNLATVFLEQGSTHYESALHCYLQAVELDATDSVVWNKLGTLSCSMGLLSTSRWAFEQGLLCSPNNWNCMEKLLEVLIAIGDEVACISVSDMILRHWPSHSRALHVKNTIEDREPIPFAPRGIDKLEPKHVRLNFPEKRKAEDYITDEQVTPKRPKQLIELELPRATWAALTDVILGILLPAVGTVSDVSFMQDHGNVGNDKVADEANPELQTYVRLERYTDIKIDLRLHPVGEASSTSSDGFEKTSMGKEKETCTDKEHHHERRSTRLERLRSRKTGKEESDCANGKELGKVFQFLEPFVLNRPKANGAGSSVSSLDPCHHLLTYTSAIEYSDIVQFISRTSKNCGAYHIIHLLLEEVAHTDIPFQDCFVKFLELEKLTRYWGQDRTPLCSLFLAELYYDQGLLSTNENDRLDLLSETSFHLCKVIESVALDSPYDFLDNSIRKTVEMNTLNKIRKLVDYTVENGNMSSTTKNTQKPSEQSSISANDTAFWARFFWLSGHISLSSGCKAKAFDEFCICLSLLRKNEKFEETPDTIILPHCKSVRALTVDRVLHEINLLKLDEVLGKTTDEMIEKGMYAECINLLAPLLLSTNDIYFDVVPCASKESGNLTSVELSALDVLMLACEKEETVNVEVYLKCHRKKLQLLTSAAGSVDSPFHRKGKSSLQVTTVAFNSDNAESTSKSLMHMIANEVKDISRCASRLKNLTDQLNTNAGFSSLVCIIGDIQSLLLTVMCTAVRTILSQRSSSGSGQAQSESLCLVDAAIVFCNLQHLDPSIPVKTQVDLIVAVHDLLAEYGLCCAGKDNEGDGGMFLKLAIKHLLALDVKLKSLNGTNGKGGNASFHEEDPDDPTPESFLDHEEHNKNGKVLESRKSATNPMLDSVIKQSERNIVPDSASSLADLEMEEVEVGIDNALEQCFFCLYGLNINPDSMSEDDLAVHKNTSRGDYQTKEQCTDVFQYILPYARALSRTGLVKLRRVLRAIRKHFPQPPDEKLAENAIDKFLDGTDVCEDKLCEITGADESREYIKSILCTNERDPETLKASTSGSDSYLEVYRNLYYFIAQSEEISATDKYAGFVLTKEGEEFVEQNANLFKYDLLYNPLRFDSWQKLATIYDEEVDLLLNDGSKHINVVDWRRNTSLSQRVEIGRRRSRRCLLMSLALAKTPEQQSQIYELLALVYYDSLQNVVPFYDQRSIVRTKDALWMKFSRNSMKYFEKAFAIRPDWLHAFYLGKLCEKMGFPSVKAFSYYSEAATLNASAVDPLYRMHASRMKLLYTQGKQSLNILQIVAAYAFNESTKDKIQKIFSCDSEDLTQLTMDVKDVSVPAVPKEGKHIEPSLLDEAWHILFNDCLSALEICVEGDLKHFHKARYMLARGLYKKDEDGDLERAKDELSFCFKSSRSSFTINLWEIDGMTKRGRRKNPGLGGNKRNLEVSLSESSRKFITCIRKYILFYLNLLEKTGDLCILERAYTYLRTDKRFSLCIGDIVPVTLGKYIQVLMSSIKKAEACETTDNPNLEQMLDKMFNVFMDHGNWAETIGLPEVSSTELSESSLYGYIHQYINFLESNIRFDALEGMNEKIRKRFKNPKLSSDNFLRVCKHASLAWCRSILIKLASLSPLPKSDNLGDREMANLTLFIDLQPDELLSHQPETSDHPTLDLNHYEALAKVKNLRITQTSDEDMEAAVALMRCTYNFYRETPCGTLPSGIGMYTVSPVSSVVDHLDLSTPRKLLLWAYMLVHGRYWNIAAVVKYCEDNAKARMRRGSIATSAGSQATHPVDARERSDRDVKVEVVDSPSVAAATSLNPETASNEVHRAFVATPQLHRCNATKGMEVDQEGCQGDNPTN